MAYKILDTDQKAISGTDQIARDGHEGKRTLDVTPYPSPTGDRHFQDIMSALGEISRTLKHIRTHLEVMTEERFENSDLKES